MALAQSQFEEFHNKIKTSYEDNQALREKRDTLLDDLKKSLPDDLPAWTPFNQGSYAINTGVIPLDGNYDIDVGLVFDCPPADYPDPVALKIKVRDALSKGNRTVQIKKSCVRVVYMKDGKPDFHVDVAIYSKDTTGLLIAKGLESSPQGDRKWERSEPNQLAAYLNNKHKDEKAAQFRRIVRNMKRWKDYLSHGNLPSIALTVAAADWLSPNFDPVSSKPRDLLALRDLIQTMLTKWNGNRLQISLPVAPFSDLLHKLTDLQMKDLKIRLTDLKNKLQDAYDEPDLHEACLLLQKQFGDDFSVPEKTETIKNTAPAVISTGNSA